MKILLDTNVILDVILQREPWMVDAGSVWAECDTGRLQGYVQASALTDIFYLVRKGKDVAGAFEAVDTCLNAFTIIPVDRAVIEQARQLPGNDFEDNVQIASAIIARLDAVVTRDPAGFKETPLSVLSPQQLLAQL
jgi:predicted nucleic acid-binding protein